MVRVRRGAWGGASGGFAWIAEKRCVAVCELQQLRLGGERLVAIDAPSRRHARFSFFLLVANAGFCARVVVTEEAKLSNSQCSCEDTGSVRQSRKMSCHDNHDRFPIGSKMDPSVWERKCVMLKRITVLTVQAK